MTDRRKSGRRAPPAKPEDEEDLWQQVARGVTPLKNRAKQILETPESPAPPAPAVKTRRVVSKPTLPAPPPLPVPPRLEVGTAPGLDRRTQRRLKRGQVEIDDRLDLHGLTQAQAHARLSGFLAGAQASGMGLVLVVTGKGLRPDGSVGVLRESVPRWLNEAPNRSRVVGFTHAAQKDGGTGALYVRLRKKP